MQDIKFLGCGIIDNGHVTSYSDTADGDVGAFHSCGGALCEATLKRVRKKIAEEQEVSAKDAEMPYYGPFTITVPGTARGWGRTVEELGELSLKRVLEPAIEYATGDFPVSEIIAEQWANAASVLSGDNS